MGQYHHLMKEKLLIKKQEIEGLINKRKRTKNIMTVNGIITIKRTILMQILDRDGRRKTREIVPLDELLRIDKLPFKMTKSMML